jgi:hypothetical protein
MEILMPTASILGSILASKLTNWVNSPTMSIDELDNFYQFYTRLNRCLFRRSVIWVCLT